MIAVFEDCSAWVSTACDKHSYTLSYETVEMATQAETLFLSPTKGRKNLNTPESPYLAACDGNVLKVKGLFKSLYKSRSNTDENRWLILDLHWYNWEQNLFQDVK